jgi:trimethylamine--corrinoid protein Co-methyltransferase
MANDTAASGRRRRGSPGRERAARDTPTQVAVLTRHLRPYEMLDEETLARLEATAETLLSEIGIEFRNDPPTLELWREAGADVDGERVRFPRGLVRSILDQNAPGQFTQHARNPERSVIWGGAHTIFAPAYGSPFVTDADNGRRYASIDDFRDLVKLAYMAPWLHHSGGTICEPVDVPVNKRHLDMVYSHLRDSDKPFLGSITAPERARDSIDMARLVFGHDFVDDHCVTLGNVNANSPLTFDWMATATLRTYAAANQGMVVMPFILGGAMGPVTGAGTVAQALAETMVGCALTQLVRPGAPCVLGAFLSSMSLQTGAPTFGTPEPAMAYLAMGQLARRLGLPLRMGGSLTASKVADAQAAQESADSLMPTLLGGAHFVLHAAGWLESGLTMGFEKLMMDIDHLGAMHTLAQGFATDDNALALEAYREMGPGQHYLGCAHTMRNYQSAYYKSHLADNRPYEQWSEEGSEDMLARAHRQWRQWLAAYEAPPIDPGVDEALRAFVRQRRESMADAWH